MEFKLNEISKHSSFSPNYTLYRINDSIYDEINYSDNLYYIIRRCGIKPWTPNHGYTTYATDKHILIYPLSDVEIYEETFEYDGVLQSTPEISSVSIIGGVVKEDKIEFQLTPEYKEYYDITHGNDIILDTVNRNSDQNSYVYKITNNYPHELVKSTFIANNTTNPAVEISGHSSQDGTPSLDNSVEFSHVGEFNGVNYRISAGQSLKLTDLNSTSNTWYLVQYNTKNYYDLNALKKMTASGTAYIDDGLLMSTTPLHLSVSGFPLDTFYTIYAKAYVWCEEDCTIQIGYYSSCSIGFWVNGKRIAYGAYWNSNRAYSVHFKKGKNLIELTTYRDLTSGGYLYLKGTSNGTYTEGIPFSTYDGISSLTYHNKYIKSVVTRDNEDFYFMSPISLKSLGNTHDTYNYSDTAASITKRIDEASLSDFTGFQTEEAANTYSIDSPVTITGTPITFNFDDVFDEIDYVTSNGTNWYDTDIDLTSENVRFDINFTLTSNISSGKALFGACSDADSEWLLEYFDNTNRTDLYLGTSNCQRYTTYSLNTPYSYSLQLDGNGNYRQTINGAVATGTYKGSVQNSSNNTIQIFRQPLTNNPNNRIPSGIRVTCTQLYLDGILVQTLTPVRRKSDNQEGLYDKTRNIFHYGAGLTQSYVQGEVEILSNKFDGVQYMLLGAESNDSIAYHEGRIYFYTTKTIEELQNALQNTIILYRLASPETITVNNPADVLNNIYYKDESINILPAYNALNNWPANYTGVSVTANDDESFTIHYNNQSISDSTARGVYKVFSTTIGKSYTLSFSAKGNYYIYIANGNSSSERWVVTSIRNGVDFQQYQYTFTADKANFRIYVCERYEKDAVVKDLNVVQNNYVQSYIVTDGNGEHGSVTFDNTMCFTYSINREFIEVESGKSYKFIRSTAGEVWQLRYRDKNQHIIGYSNYLDTTAVQHIETMPTNCYYVELIDGSNLTSGYSVSLNENSSENSTIETIEYNNGVETVTLTLPHILNPGDELVYEESYNEWIYYPLSLSSDCIYYSEDIFGALLLNNVNHITVDSHILLTTVVAKRNSRELIRPVITSITDAQDTGIGFGYVAWDEVIGANEYRIYIGNTLIATVNNILDAKTFQFNLASEYSGKLTIVAANTSLLSNASYGYNVTTVPNTPFVKVLDSVFENNRYYITVEFDVNSKLVDGYNLAYSVDGAAVVVANLDGNPNKLDNLTRSCSFTVANISSGIDVNIYAINNTGTNNYMTTAHYSTVDGFTKWTYKQTLHQVLLAWTDRLTNEDKYLLKYSINNGEWMIAESDRGLGSNTQLLEYLALAEDAEMRVCLTPVIGGQRQIFTKPITVSKANDRTLVPPANFTGVKVRNGLIQFSWDDTYGIADTHFELFYRYSDGTTQTIAIPHASDGNRDYSYRINTDTYGFANAKIKMIWELGESNYSTELTIYDLPDADTPPDMKHQTRENGGKTLRLSWTAYDYLLNYTLSLAINGQQSSIVCYDPYYEYIIPSSQDTIHIVASVRATNIGGENTSYSDELDFVICNTSNRESQTIYVHAEEDKFVYTTIMGTGLLTPYNLYTLSQNSFTSSYILYEKSYKAYLEKMYQFEENYWGHNVGASGRLMSWISNSALKSYPVKQITYQQVENSMPLHYTIFFRAVSEYKLYSEFTKMIIACFGDSITAGHPNYWAETGTGDVTSQYEYWLSRRLKDEYNVVNKGYGQEKTNDMLERFDRDISGIGAHYCIILGGTNDWYQDASTKDLATGYTVMDGAIDNIKQIVSKCWDNNIYPVVGTLTPRNDITEDGKKLFDYFNDWVKDWTTEQSLLGKKCAYVDFFNAGKDLDPPCPLEDPDKPYHLNPLCDYVLHT